MGKWVVVYEPDEPPMRWQCVTCEAPLGQPHVEGCKCTLVEAAPIEDAEGAPTP